MAKKKKSRGGDAPLESPVPDLPQNILPMGEQVEENKRIYISQTVYKLIHRFTRNKTVNESGGFLIGDVVDSFGKTNIIIRGFIEAKHCEATPTSLKFTHDTWSHCHQEMGKKFAGKKIIGWIHTHPNFGLILSDYDLFIQESFFKEEHQIAYVIDPIQNIEGFYFWINDKIQRCKGFYIFDETGKRISVETEGGNDLKADEKSSGMPLRFQNIVTVILAIAVVLLSFSALTLHAKVNRLETEQRALILEAGQRFSILEQEISNLQNGTAAEFAPSDGATGGDQ